MVNEWTELTTDNEDEVYQKYDERYPVVIATKNFDMIYPIYELYPTSATIHTMAKYGGYYYMILPKLR